MLAKVAEIANKTSVNSGRLILDIRGQSLAVNASVGDTDLQAGDLVKIMRTGNELRLIGKLANAAESSIAQALAQRLPWQQAVDSGIAKALASLTAGIRAEPGASAQPVAPSERSIQSLPAPVRQAIEQLATLLPERKTLAGLAENLTRGSSVPLATNPTTSGSPLSPGTQSSASPAQIKQWIEQSGVFAEGRVARSPEAPPADLKLAVGRVIHQLLNYLNQPQVTFNSLTPIASPDLVQAPLQFPGTISSPPPTTSSSEPTTVGQMLRLLAGVLNRITVNQLHSQILSTRTTADAPAPNTTLLIDLPWLNQNNEPRTAQVRIEEQPQETESEKRAKSKMTEWKLSLAMNLDEAGQIHFDVALGHGRLSAQVWAEKQATLQRAQEELPALRKSLSDIGLEVVDLECRRGIPRGATTQLEHRLVDTRA